MCVDSNIWMSSSNPILIPYRSTTGREYQNTRKWICCKIYCYFESFDLYPKPQTPYQGQSKMKVRNHHVFVLKKLHKNFYATFAPSREFMCEVQVKEKNRNRSNFCIQETVRVLRAGFPLKPILFLLTTTYLPMVPL